jgi:hypothetical protein
MELWLYDTLVSAYHKVENLTNDLAEEYKEKISEALWAAVIATASAGSYDTLLGLDIITRITVSDNGYQASFNDVTHVLNYSPATLKGNIPDIAVDTIHEVRHAAQLIFKANAPSTGFDSKKWNDRVYCEWDAYKTSGDIEDYMRWWSNWGPMNPTSYAQSLNLDSSYNDYNKFYTRFFSGWTMSYADFWEKVYNGDYGGEDELIIQESDYSR